MTTGPRAGLPLVVVQGLGYVGAAMAVAVAAATDADGAPAFRVAGLELPSPEGLRRATELGAGRIPFATTDASLTAAAADAVDDGALTTGTDPAVMADAAVVVVDVAVDVDWRAAEPTLHREGFEAALRDVGRHVSPGALVLIETTVPPGTTERVALPVLASELTRRGLDPSSVLVAHSYERVMPGPDYLASITRYWRAYAGATVEAADAAEAFLATVIDVEEFPLTRLASTTASETAKVLENTFRATTIALMDEWAAFAEEVGVDLFEVVDAIRARPTHANLRTPGFGVGGYCITKDPLLAPLAAREVWGLDLAFPFAEAAARANAATPITVVDRIARALDGLDGRSVLLAGVSYRSDVADTRHSPSETFVREARARGATVVAHDPLVRRWDELGEDLPAALPVAEGLDAVVFAVPHQEYRSLDVLAWLGTARPVVCDAFDVLSAATRAALQDAGITVLAVGRGTP